MMSRPLFLSLACVLFALALPPADGARAGKLEPFLARLTAADPAKRIPPACPLLCWDSSEAARSRARVLIHRCKGVTWERMREKLAETAPSHSWEGEAGDFAQVLLDFDELARVAELAEVFYVLRPPRAVPCVEVVSEGLDSMKVKPFQNLGYHGQGVKVAVLDMGFYGYQTLLGSELPLEPHVRSFFRSPSGNGDITGDEIDHGTACAEIVHEIAPEAELYLVNVETPIDLNSAVEWLTQEKISVVSHSLGWYFGGLDGTGPINDVADRAVDNGIFWANAAGNEADRHTWAYAADTDGDRVLEIAEADERISFTRIRPGMELAMALLWDEWPTATNLDLILEFVDEDNEVLATTEEEFRGYPYAFRYLAWTSPDGRAVAIRVRARRGTPQGETIHLFRIGPGGVFEEHRRADRSLLAPADSRSVVAVGAVAWATDSLVAYSSRGALDGEPVKPELCAPVGVSTRVYGPRAFHGTSAAAPHVAGAATLLASTGLCGSYSQILPNRDELIRLLQEHAKAANYIDPLAWGIVRMPTRSITECTTALRLLGNPATGTLRWSGACETIEIIDPAGRVVARCGSPTWDGTSEQGNPVPAGVYWIRCPGQKGAARLTWLGR